jgi:hypothetical protein
MYLRPETSEGAYRVRTALFAEGVLAGVGFVLLFIGARISVVVAILGTALVCLGAVLGVRALALVCRDRSLGSADMGG